MTTAYSRLKMLLAERDMPRAELRRRIAAVDSALNGAALSRLLDPDRPLQPADWRIAEAASRALGVELDEVVVPAESAEPLLQTLPKSQQRRLNELMDRHNDGQLNDDELAALRALVAEAEAISRSNAERLVQHRRRLSQWKPVTSSSTPG
jgi:hypothetical protein